MKAVFDLNKFLIDHINKPFTYEDYEKAHKLIKEILKEHEEKLTGTVELLSKDTQALIKAIFKH